jgi:8-oxo-dGTP diphosphatase
MPTLKQVVCAVIRDPEGRILLARRAPGQHLEGHWELPGGKVEPGESLEAALERELLEELGLVVTVGEELARTVYHYERGSIELIALATTTDGEIDHMAVHDAVHWFTAAKPRRSSWRRRTSLCWNRYGRPSERLSEHLVQRRCGKNTFRPTQQRVGICGLHLFPGTLGQIAETQRQLPQQQLRLTLPDTPLHALFQTLFQTLLQTLLQALFQTLLPALLHEPLCKPCHLCHLLRIPLAVDDAFILVQRCVDVDEIQVLELPLGIRLEIRQPTHRPSGHS